MNRSDLLRAFILLVVATSMAAASTHAAPVSSRWSRNAVWDDGLAEIAVYRASRTIYGASRPYEAVLITVKEDFDGGALVKAAPPFGDRQITPVLKLNAVREIATPNYDYRIMTSTFVEREDPTRLVKLTSGSHEWCGNTWKAIRRHGSTATYDWASYFDGEADGEQELEMRHGDLLLDQVPLALRGLEFRRGLRFDTRLLPSLSDSRAGRVRWRSATVRVVGPEVLQVPAGRFDTWRVEIDAEGHHSSWWFDATGTHPLIRMESDDGERMALDRIERRAYWLLP